MKTQINVILAMLAVLTVIALGVVLKLTGDVLVPLLVAWLLAQVFKPIMSLGKRLRLPHILNVILVFLIIFIVLLLGVRFFRSQLADSERLVALYGPKLNEYGHKAMEFFQLSDESFSFIGLLRQYIGSISGSVINLSSQFIMTLIFLVFMLLEIPVWDKKVNAAFSGTNAAKIRHVLQSISLQTSQYLGTMVFVSFLTGVIAWGTLAVLGVEFAGGWGILTFFLNFIPNIGPLIATVPPVMMAMLQFSPTAPEPLIALVVLGVMQTVTGNILAPKLFGDRLDLSPVVVMLSLLLFTLLLGIPGAIMSVPIASIIKIVCENIPSMKPLAVMMGTGAAVAKEEPRPDVKK